MHYLIETKKKKMAGKEESYSKVYSSDESDVDDFGFDLFDDDDDDYERPQRGKFILVYDIFNTFTLGIIFLFNAMQFLQKYIF